MLLIRSGLSYVGEAISSSVTRVMPFKETVSGRGGLCKRHVELGHLDGLLCLYLVSVHKQQQVGVPVCLMTGLLAAPS